MFLYINTLMTSTWGPQVWRFLHKLVASIKDDSFYIVGNQALTYIIQICSMLPCPDCSNHARMFFNKINKSSINSRTKLIDLIFIFHNEVNKRTKKQINFPYNSLNIYDNINLYKAYNDFFKVYKINTSAKLSTDTFHKGILLKNLYNWLTSNRTHFIPIQSSPIPSQSQPPTSIEPTQPITQSIQPIDNAYPSQYNLQPRQMKRPPPRILFRRINTPQPIKPSLLYIR